MKIKERPPFMHLPPSTSTTMVRRPQKLASKSQSDLIDQSDQKVDSSSPFPTNSVAMHMAASKIDSHLGQVSSDINAACSSSRAISILAVDIDTGSTVVQI